MASKIVSNIKLERSRQASGQGNACELTILMPCLNEEATVGRCVEKALGYLRRRKLHGEVIVADNGSTDDSQRIAAAHGARVVHVSKRGYGSALIGGIAHARGRYVIMGDADDSYDFSDLDPFVEKFHEGFDFVMGNRFKGGIKPGAMPFLHRYLGNPVLSWIGRTFFKIPIGDFHCGLRGFKRAALLQLGLTCEGMEFASEMVVKAKMQGLRLTEVPTTLSPDGRDRPPHLNTWHDGWRNLRFLLLFSPKWLFLYPGILLLFLGFTSMVLLIAGPFTVGDLTLDVNTLVYCSVAIICGFQAAAFWILAQVFAMNAKLLPKNARIAWIGHMLSLELTIAVGLLLVLGGLITSAYAVSFWGMASFGPLDPRVSLRIVVPAATAIVLGLQIIYCGFFLSILNLKVRQ
jgi:glycosyltransferase involved in cell wall biosynthesis